MHEAFFLLSQGSLFKETFKKKDHSIKKSPYVKSADPVYLGDSEQGDVKGDVMEHVHKERSIGYFLTHQSFY